MFISEVAMESPEKEMNMFGPLRGFPFRGLALVAVGFMAASVVAGAPGAVAGLALVPLFLFKMLFVFFVFGSFLRLAGAGSGGWGPGRGRWHGQDRGSSAGSGDREFDRERWEWEESLRRAREELREYDTPFSPPPEGFEPPADEREI